MNEEKSRRETVALTYDELSRLGVDKDGNSIHDNSPEGRKRRLAGSKRYAKKKIANTIERNKK